MKAKWLVTLLVISLSFNLLIIGAVLGRMTTGFGPIRSPGDPSLGYFIGLRELPRQRWALVRPVIRHHFKSMRPTLRDIRPAQQAMLDALAATPFSAANLRQSLERLRTLLGKTQAESHASLVEVSSLLNHDERLKLAEFMRRSQHHHPARPRPHPAE